MNNEWLIFTTIIAIISGFLLVYTPLHNASEKREEKRLAQEKEIAASRDANTKAITELTTSLRIFTEHFNKVEEDNRMSHKEIYNRLDEKGKTLAKYGEQLENHERRLGALERKERTE